MPVIVVDFGKVRVLYLCWCSNGYSQNIYLQAFGNGISYPTIRYAETSTCINGDLNFQLLLLVHTNVTFLQSSVVVNIYIFR